MKNYIYLLVIIFFLNSCGLPKTKTIYYDKDFFNTNSESFNKKKFTIIHYKSKHHKDSFSTGILPPDERSLLHFMGIPQWLGATGCSDLLCIVICLGFSFAVIKLFLENKNSLPIEKNRVKFSYIQKLDFSNIIEIDKILTNNSIFSYVSLEEIKIKKEYKTKVFLYDKVQDFIKENGLDGVIGIEFNYYKSIDRDRKSYKPALYTRFLLYEAKDLSTITQVVTNVISDDEKAEDFDTKSPELLNIFNNLTKQSVIKFIELLKEQIEEKESSVIKLAQPITIKEGSNF